MKYRVHYYIPKIVEIDLEEGQDLAENALWAARHVSGANVKVTHVLKEGEVVEQDLPRKPRPELPLPPVPPLGSAGDVLLARAA